MLLYPNMSVCLFVCLLFACISRCVIGIDAAIPLHAILQLGGSPATPSGYPHRKLENNGNGKRDLQDTSFAQCTDTVPNIMPESMLGTGQCITGWEKDEWEFYPYDFQGMENKVYHYECPVSNKRIIFSNGVPDHSVRVQTSNLPCEKFWFLRMPLHPTYDGNTKTEPMPAGMVAMAMNGVPIFGAKEALGGNAVEPDASDATSVWDARFWYGHATVDNIQHYHNPSSGVTASSSDTLIGYSIDGFPLYGPLEDDSVLDDCNGRFVNGQYQYHVRTLDQVDETSDYCKPNNDPAVGWPYILGCYHGSLEETKLKANANWTMLDTEIDDDCVLVGGSEFTSAPAPTPPPAVVDNRPNIIIIQPDDLPFYAGWTPPPNNPVDLNKLVTPPANFTMSNIEKLRTRGVQMMNAYTTSPACGTSRFSTITGKYPSRSAYNREKTTTDLMQITIPRTKLEDVPGYGDDCSSDNLAAVLKGAGYRTGMVGKWHLTKVNASSYDYDDFRENVKSCGFDFAEALYAENLDSDTTQGVDLDEEDPIFGHNMELVTSEAVNFIKSRQENEPFLLYFNPTVPHSSASVEEAFTNPLYNCTVTPNLNDPLLPEDPMIKGMTLEYGSCAEYRQSVVRRAGGPQNSNENLGVVWLDDAIGAILHALMDHGIYENTMIVFQQDHGIETKQMLYENGNRIAQFVHFPNEYGLGGKEFHGMVSTIDLAPTFFDFANVANHYALDGKSWRSAMQNATQEGIWQDDRCLYFENQRDRAVRCGCNKMLKLFDPKTAPTAAPTASPAPTPLDYVPKLGTYLSNTLSLGVPLGYSNSADQLVDLCNLSTGELITYPEQNPEETNLFQKGKIVNDIQQMFEDVMSCFAAATDHQSTPDFAADCDSLFDKAVVDAYRCLDDSDCTFVCDPSTQVCAECYEDSQCSNNYFCTNFGACAECTMDEHCSTNQICNKNTNRCKNSGAI